MRASFALLLILSGTLLSPGQSQTTHPEAVEPWPAQPMRPDRADDSYVIYSRLLPLGETASWPAAFYAVEDTTITAVPPDASCWVPPAKSAIDRARVSTTNPHVGVQPPEESRLDYEQLMADFDAHCHERVTLSKDSWKATLPVQLLNPAEQSEFHQTRNTRQPVAKKYDGSPSLYAFSQVYFNAHHTVAMVYATHWCGGLCGQGFWVVFRRNDGVWKQLNWSSVSWIS